MTNIIKKRLSASGELPEEEVEKQDHFFKEVAEDGIDKEARWLKKRHKDSFRIQEVNCGG
ncbi:hypothetical protein QIU19_07580 [Capnocytophaga canimorsus]|nr:hypothetical protein [Capnocytophaga canimorsus]WGU67467.1 hypothetical protein QIU19_07580 [Capnocytophaga canimorsus]